MKQLLKNITTDCVGIDTHKYLHVAVHTRIDGNILQSFSFSDISQVENIFLNIPKSTPFVLEDSNLYGKHLKEELIKQGYSVFHAPSKFTKKSNTKSDTEDARQIALNFLHDITKTKQLNIFDTKYMKLKTIVKQRRKNNKDLIALKNHIHSELFKKLGMNYKKIIGFKNIFCKAGLVKLKASFILSKEIEEQLISKAIDKIEILQEENKLIEKYFKNSNDKEIEALTKISQVSYNTAAEILTEVQDIKRFSKESKLLRYAGVAPIEDFSSGKIKHKLDTTNNRTLNSILFDIAVRQFSKSKEVYTKHACRKKKRYICGKIYRLLNNVNKPDLNLDTVELLRHNCLHDEDN